MHQEPKRATIRDVAKAAGVATSTVSRSFTDPDRVHPVTRRHILEISDDLGYLGGNPAARALLRGRTETLALLVPDITNPHFAHLIRGAERQAAKAGYTLVIADTEESPAAEQRHIERLRSSVDGIMLGASRLSERNLRATVQHSRVVLINRRVDGVPSVIADQRRSVTQIVQHLHDLGHRRLAYLPGPATSWVAERRWEALVAAGNRYAVSIVRLGPFAPVVAGGAAASDALLECRATAAVTHNALIAMGVLGELANRGISVPDEFSVIALDDILTAEFFVPALTARVGPMEELGRTAVNLLLRDIDPRAVERPFCDDVELDTEIPARLAVRGSTSVAPTRPPTPRSVPATARIEMP